jgi:hypothetical protein
MADQVMRGRTADVLAGTSTVEAIAGIGAVVLAIMGLADILPGLMAPIATIAVGVALWIEGGAFSARQARYAREQSGEAEVPAVGTSAELLAGAAGTILGILALVRVAPFTLMAVALTLYGTGLLLGAAAWSRSPETTTDVPTTTTIGEATIVRAPVERRQGFAAELMRQTASAAVGGQVLIGIAALVLGVCSLVRIENAALVLAGLLSLGLAVFLNATASGASLATLRRHR